MVKSEYTGSIRHFTLHEVDGKKVNIGIANIKKSQSPIDAAKKLLSCYCRDKNIKSNQRNKVNIIFTIIETTRGHSKIYGPYKGYFVKYDKPVTIKLKNGKIIKKTLKPIVKLDSVVQKGGQSNENLRLMHLKDNLINIIKNLNESKTTTDKEKYKDKLSGYVITEITDMNNLFKNFNFINNPIENIIQKWDVSKVTTMKSMFSDAKFNNENNFLQNWYVSNVKYMNNMFFNSDFNQDLSGWNVSNVEDMSCMFFNSNFNQDLSKWNFTNVKNMSYMFYKCRSFNQDLSKWNLNKILSNRNSNKVENMSYMFAGCFNLSIYNGKKLSWNLNKNCKVENMFIYCNKLFNDKRIKKIRFSSIFSEEVCSNNKETCKEVKTIKTDIKITIGNYDYKPSYKIKKYQDLEYWEPRDSNTIDKFNEWIKKKNKQINTRDILELRYESDKVSKALSVTLYPN